ncbi:MAG: RluA family pseudouridine synthase [Oscillospiraceae bacterium]|nr:RluA family pseudouridine synthase [Oscillospiraceae bacterium]
MEPVILWRNGEAVCCVKPAGVLSERSGMPDRLEEMLSGTVYCVHRLDKSVGGVMIYARSGKAAARLSEGLAGRSVHKLYLAVVHGRPAEPLGMLRDLLYHDPASNKSFVVMRPRRGVRQAELRYELLQSAETDSGLFSLLRIELLTGRSHQIRVQFASRKMPLVGDGRYGSPIRLGGPALWSTALRFDDPLPGAPAFFSALPPAEWPWTLFSIDQSAVEVSAV